jgi:hypothetical protein
MEEKTTRKKKKKKARRRRRENQRRRTERYGEREAAARNPTYGRRAKDCGRILDRTKPTTPLPVLPVGGHVRSWLVVVAP